MQLNFNSLLYIGSTMASLSRNRNPIQSHEAFTFLLETISISFCRKAERYFCTKCRVVQFIWLCSIYIVAISKKNFHYFPRSCSESDNRRLDANWYPLESSHAHYAERYIICRRIYERKRPFAVLSIAKRITRDHRRNVSNAAAHAHFLTHIIYTKRYCLSKAALLGRNRGHLRCDACTFYTTSTHETHNNNKCTPRSQDSALYVLYYMLWKLCVGAWTRAI